MTTRDLAAAMARRWYVVLIGLLATSAFVAMLSDAREVYWTRADVVFYPPDRPGVPGNALAGSNESIVFFAAAVERAVNGDTEPVRLASPDAALYGTGVENGYSVTLPNAGGQWQTNYNRSVLAVQVVDATKDGVRRKLDSAVASVRGTARELQSDAGVTEAAMMPTRLSPQHPQITPVAGRSDRAALGVVLIGLLLTLATAVLIDRRLWRRSAS